MMDENKYAVILTEEQGITILECDPKYEIFDTARLAIGCDWIEIVDAEDLTEKGYLMLIDEEGKLRDGDLPINCIASDLYGADRHGDPIVGNAMIVKDGDEQLELLSHDEAKQLASAFLQQRDRSVEKISRAFGLVPAEKQQHEMSDLFRRHPCGKDSMER